MASVSRIAMCTLEDVLLPVFGALVVYASILAASLISCLVLFLCYIKIRQLKTWKFMKKFPGASSTMPMIPMLSTWKIHRTLSKQAHLVDYGTQIFQLAAGSTLCFKKQGMFRFYDATQAVLAIFKADPVEELLTSNVILDKGKEYDIIRPWLASGLLTSAGSKWRLRRKLLTPAFHFRILEDFLPVVNAQSRVFVENLRSQGKERSYNIVPPVTMCTLDIICETIMGYVINAQKNKCSDYVQAIQVVGEAFTRRLESPAFWIEPIFRLSQSGRQFFDSIKELHEFTTKVIQGRKKELQKEPQEAFNNADDDDVYGMKSSYRRPFLDILLREHLKDPHNFTEEDVREEVDTFMFEGHDTTAMGISWALYLIGLYREQQDLIHQELDSIFGDDKVRQITSNDLKEMKYLECCLKESQRLYPSVPFIARTCKGNLVIAGNTVPKGATVQIPIYNLHRDETVFPKPEEFIPERFLPENAKGRHPFAYIPFSAGPRNCIGQRFAMMEEKIVVAHVLRNYKLRSLHHRDTIRVVAEMVLRPKNGLFVQFLPR
ncbi:unnamed protein product [Ixodes persulcatus]